MSDKERLIVLALGTLLLFLAPGYLLHVAPRFPGSLAGGLLGITAASLMLLVLLYPAIKYVGWLRAWVTRHVPLGRLLSLHIYGGLLAALIAILHSGHNYRSVLGIALVLDILVIIGTGFVGRYYLGHLGAEVRQQQALLGTLRSVYDRIAFRLGAAAGSTSTAPNVPILSLVDAIADVEYSLAMREAAKRIAARWTVIHIIASIVFYGLLLLHIGSGIYYGLRWLP
ncbi:MAG: iron reductase [Reyranella sp.]|uniref:iron reductase n=1 Tax=Reyranella sp. TaxID=1929291 RepID=UPI00121591AE|nr:iron reductase [Reyranella sp.]TAJ36081.1 MAG: iron reductase [Reyranella sp.]